MSQPEGVWSDGKRLAVADTLNHRVLLWDEIVTTTPVGQQPNRVLGQAGFDVALLQPPAAGTLRDPRAVASDGTHLAVSDFANNRVLLWSSWPQQDAQPANTVLGQADFFRRTPNDASGDGIQDPAPNAHTMRSPAGIAFHQDKLLVMDRGNHRLLIFKSN